MTIHDDTSLRAALHDLAGTMPDQPDRVGLVHDAAGRRQRRVNVARGAAIAATAVLGVGILSVARTTGPSGSPAGDGATLLSTASTTAAPTPPPLAPCPAFVPGAVPVVPGEGVLAVPAVPGEAGVAGGGAAPVAAAGSLPVVQSMMAYGVVSAVSDTSITVTFPDPPTSVSASAAAVSPAGAPGLPAVVAPDDLTATIGADTTYADGDVTLGARPAIAVGDHVEISAERAGDGSFAATRVRLNPPAPTAPAGVVAGSTGAAAGGPGVAGEPGAIAVAGGGMGVQIDGAAPAGALPVAPPVGAVGGSVSAESAQGCVVVSGRIGPGEPGVAAGAGAGVGTEPTVAPLPATGEPWPGEEPSTTAA